MHKISKGNLDPPFGVIVRKEDFRLPNEVIEGNTSISSFSDTLEFTGLGDFRDSIPIDQVSHLIVKIVMYPFKALIGEELYNKLRSMKFALLIISDSEKSLGKYDRVVLLSHLEKPKIFKLKIEGTEGRIVEEIELKDGSLHSGKVLKEDMGFVPPSEEEIMKYIEDKSHIFPDIHHIWAISIPLTLNVEEEILIWFNRNDPKLIRKP
ncbi:MAG: hypothetical protein ACTSPU_03885 [Promethearchaeota archaeon]